MLFIFDDVFIKNIVHSVFDWHACAVRDVSIKILLSNFWTTCRLIHYMVIPKSTTDACQVTFSKFLLILTTGTHTFENLRKGISAWFLISFRSYVHVSIQRIDAKNVFSREMVNSNVWKPNFLSHLFLYLVILHY